MELGIFWAKSDEAIKYVSFAQSEINFGRSESLLPEEHVLRLRVLRDKNMWPNQLRA